MTTPVCPFVKAGLPDDVCPAKKAPPVSAKQRLREKTPSKLPPCLRNFHYKHKIIMIKCGIENLPTHYLGWVIEEALRRCGSLSITRFKRGKLYGYEGISLSHYKILMMVFPASGDGKVIDFWTDPYFADTNLKSSFPRIFINSISSSPMNPVTKDRIRWSGTPNGVYLPNAFCELQSSELNFRSEGFLEGLAGLELSLEHSGSDPWIVERYVAVLGAEVDQTLFKTCGYYRLDHLVSSPAAGSWTAPPQGKLKFNVDASVQGSFGSAGIGGVLHDQKWCEPN
ncbi:hypothetical protein F3Y22_tig00111213pilonHSYRG00444 [Hibiscus syriacus]|uniref:Uncharacterized protein n=1 Tax=Hibiscus syriacus TaxID=106335 RepID=A0A6A2YV10_HIBSY|nr:hypothetical protein F3Y22_tig00111213pilonHSYRG00444 [Hibiscus syriacus]